MTLLAGSLGAGAGVVGAMISAAGRGLSTGPVIVVCISVVVLVSLLIAPGRGLLWEWLHHRANRRRFSRELRKSR
jgi:manganese/zinc/iron transport system permease protein